MEAIEINASHESSLLTGEMMELASGLSPGIDPPAPRPRPFSPADVAQEFGAGFLDEKFCRRWILETIHGEGQIACPECRDPLTTIALQRFREGRRICCRACGKFFTARTGTFLDGSHMDFPEIILLAVFLHYKVHPREVARILKISHETVRLWEIKFNALERMKGMGR